MTEIKKFGLDLHKKIDAFSKLGEYIRQEDKALNEVKLKSYHYNKWFTEDNVNQSLKAIAAHYLNPDKLEQWLLGYSLKSGSSKTIGLVMAGNIPLVGFHDFLTVLITGNKAQVKLSSKDQFLLPFIADRLIEIEPGFKDQIAWVDRLKGFDAVIATGSNNAARYFDYYFGKYPHIIRKNRNSVAVLTGEESESDIPELGKDIFQYFGLGCRNVSKLYVPKGYDFNALLHALQPFHTMINHDGYKNNYDYQRTLLLMNMIPHHANEFIMFSENQSLHSPISALYFEYYDSLEEVQSKIEDLKSEIQCVASNANLPDALPLGKAQEPELWDYADEVDTVEFLTNLT